MTINPQEEACKNILLLETRLATFLIEETRLKMSVQKLESAREIRLTYTRLKDLQNLILKHQVILNQIYTALASITAPDQSQDTSKPFGIGELRVIDMLTLSTTEDPTA